MPALTCPICHHLLLVGLKRPTQEELRDFLVETTAQGMTPEGQARHLVWHWADMVELDA